MVISHFHFIKKTPKNSQKVIIQPNLKGFLCSIRLCKILDILFFFQLYFLASVTLHKEKCYARKKAEESSENYGVAKRINIFDFSMQSCTVYPVCSEAISLQIRNSAQPCPITELVYLSRLVLLNYKCDKLIWLKDL